MSDRNSVASDFGFVVSQQAKLAHSVFKAGFVHFSIVLGVVNAFNISKLPFGYGSIVADERIRLHPYGP